MSEYKDYIVRAIASNDELRAFAITSKNLVSEAKEIYDYSPVAIAALGRLLSAGLLMGDMLKDEKDLLTLIISSDGELKQILVTANNKGEVKGYVSNPKATSYYREDGHLDVAKSVGKGTLTVIRDYQMKEPYNSTIDLHSSEIADDLTYYFAQSEQTPSSVGLGVLVSPDGKDILASGGFIIQLMPFTSETTIAKLEENLKEFTSVTDVLKEGKTPEDMLALLLKGFDYRFTEKKEVKFKCNCSQERGEKILATLTFKELYDMIKEDKTQEVTCAFCNKRYYYTKEDLIRIKDEKLKNMNSKDNKAD